MSDLIFAARSLVTSNLGWFHKTRSTLGEAAGNERAININREVLNAWFPQRQEGDLSPISIRTRYFDGTQVGDHPFNIVTHDRTIRNQGGGKNWRMAGDAVQGEFYDVRVEDIMLMVFDKSNSTLAWLVVRRGGDPSRNVPQNEATLHAWLIKRLGPPKQSMWLIEPSTAIQIITEIRSVFAKAGELLMEDKAMMEAWQNDLASTGFKLVQMVDRRLLLALKAKRFAILTGLSGSGKTLLARAFVRWMSMSRDQYAVIAVGSNWTSNDHIMGYPDALDSNRYAKTATLELVLRAYLNPHLPHFLILDEMNLSHVERYFADFLSAIESPDEPIILHSGDKPRGDVPRQLDHLPANLFVIGTVNVDETTYMFSPKVLDRANVIEFRAGEEALSNFLAAPKALDMAALDAKGSGYAKGFLDGYARQISSTDFESMFRRMVSDELLLLFRILSRHDLEFGFRSAAEILRYFYFSRSAAVPTTPTMEMQTLRDSLDAQVLQKLMPRLHGSRKRLEPVLLELGAYCSLEHSWDLAGVLDIAPIDAGCNAARTSGEIPRMSDGASFLPMAAYKIDRMLSRVRTNGFVSFAEG